MGNHPRLVVWERRVLSGGGEDGGGWFVGGLKLRVENRRNETQTFFRLLDENSGEADVNKPG
jgi:hypothetical protein